MCHFEALVTMNNWKGEQAGYGMDVVFLYPLDVLTLCLGD